MTDTYTDQGLGGLILGAFAKLQLSFDGLRSEIRQARQERVPMPALVRIQYSAGSGSATDFAIDCEGPAQGQIWELTALWISGSTFTTTVAGKAFIAISPTNPVSQGGTLIPGHGAVGIDQATSLPKAGQYSRGQVTIRHPDHLWVVIDTPTANTQYFVTGQALSVTEEAVAQRFLI